MQVYSISHWIFFILTITFSSLCICSEGYQPQTIQQMSKAKIFNDPIHGHIELSALAVKLIDTPQFQRLRDISQLGGVYFVFPGASSNRFEHSLGVCHLARVFIQRLRENQPTLDISEADALCVELAGLCHDLGHGPFSHLYDGRFLPLMRQGSHDFCHEHASIGILDILIEENNLLPYFHDHGLTSDDIHFIKELILGDEDEAPQGFVWKGRGKKTFLYDIVANKRNGIDVDKFDYFARDCHSLGLTKSFDAMRLMKFARVFPVDRDEYRKSHQMLASPSQRKASSSTSSSSDLTETSIGHLEICFHVKEAWNIFELFHTRYALHKRAYQHRVSHAIELMICEAFRLADPFILIPGHDNQLRKMSECPEDLHAYWKLGEYLLRQIENTYVKELEEARHLIQRIRKRDLFTCAGETIMTPALRARLASVKLGYKEHDVKKQLQELLAKKQEDHVLIESQDFFCQIVKIGYGKGNINPVSTFTAFYEPDKTRDNYYDCNKYHPRLAGEVENIELEESWKVGVVPEDSVSRVIPREFEEVYVRVFTRRKEQARLMKSVFLEWCDTHSIQMSSLTPIKRSREE